MLKRAKVFVVFAVLLSLMIPVVVLAKEFPDVPQDHWGQNEIREMSNFGFIAGAPDGNFYPDNPVTRAEFAAMIVNSLKLPVTTEKQATFQDVSKKHWAFGVIEAAGKEGFINGYQGLFRPNDKISREEMGVIVMKISGKYGYGLDGSISYLGKYKDNDQISVWAAPSLNDAAKFGYLEEVSYSVYAASRYNRVLAPLDNATRAQAVAAINRVLRKVGLI